jgi:hypothetical protein
MVITACFFPACTSYTSTSDSGLIDDGKSNKAEAWVCAQFKVESMLSDPASASFQAISTSSSVEAYGNEQYAISSYVDAQNGFGGTAREYFTCSITYNPNTDGCVSICSFE